MLETKTVTDARSPLPRPERARQLLLAPEAQSAAGRAVRLAATGLRAPVAMLSVPDGVRLRLAAQIGVPEPWAGAGALPLHSSPCRHVLCRNEPLLIDNLQRDPVAREDTPLEGLVRGGYAGVTVRLGGEPLAVLSVRHAGAHLWTEDEITLLRDVADVLSRELEAAESAARPEPVRREPDWRARENRWRVLLEQSGSGVFAATRDGQLLELNAAVQQMLGGVSLEEARQLSLPELCVRAEEWPLFQRELELQGFVSNRELTLRRRDGGEAHCVFSAAVRRSERGEVVGYEGVMRDVTDQRQAEKRLLESALHDPLTRLPNRTLLLDRLERLLRHSKRRVGYRFALLFIDLDRFKEVNDVHGHLAGDRLLVSVADRLAECVRQEDTVARIGGDEFAVLLDAIGDATGVIQAAERILYELAQPYDEVPAGIGASIGIALSMTGYDSVDSLLRDADTAMYRAKAAGANRYAVFDAEMDRRMRAQLELETQLRQALQRDQLKLHYHPVVAIDGGKVTGMEALLRWSHPDRGVLLPDDFIPLAERTGLIVDIGWWVIREACRQLRSWQDEYPEVAAKLTMSVNLSSRQFLQPELVQKIDRILQETGVDPTRLRLDVTEASVTQNALLAARLLSQLGERGIQICIDDFGTGYSSLNELRKLPISGIKIAPRFVRELQTPENGSRAVVQTIIALGRSMAIEAIAEGVETPEQLEQLRTLGTRFAQGFLFSLPLDSEHARALIAR